MPADEIVLPFTKPETEWVRGRALQKVSPTWNHARLQFEFAARIEAACGEHGTSGPEWRFRVPVPGEPVRPLVPDVGYLSLRNARTLSDEELQVPRLAPDVAIEILSPYDKRRDVKDKTSQYLRAGTQLVVIVSPEKRSIELHDGGPVRTLQSSDVFEHPALPGLTFSIDEYFAAALARR